ncbi:HDOD domain-containing protein [Pseudomonas sp. LPB0260]|uniref:HDOD domain-containing protein n=1 Tax=Pseudomonas sp. LPB0260 TaxID=2614442 RepID=UPI0015C2A2F2|nr:HDOD domain-containing protein [Pseudomonas sp. LPB0260]QLC72768.1 HDOD domain-containing protein [Pseudomonas sp. LPB0260]QLC75542.1 HDOD domain-containing protein [Pseudomonas sp. LPB0260]
METLQSDYSVYRDLIAQLMSDQEQLPSLPSLTWKIRRALAEPEVSISQLVELISQDPALSALLMKYASSALLRSRMAPRNLLDVMRVLGLQQVDRVVMVHSVKSLFTLHSAEHKQLFMEAWHRLTLKASVCAFLARMVGHIPADHAVLACLLSEVGSLAVLSAFKSQTLVPTKDRYLKLCRAYSKSLGVMLLKKWAVDEAYVQIIRDIGDWTLLRQRQIELIDLVNLGLYHAVKDTNPAADLPPIDELAAYAKLAAPQNELDEHGCLSLVSQHWDEIHSIAAALR